MNAELYLDSNTKKYMRKRKKLLCVDPKTGEYSQYICSLKKDVTESDLVCFENFLYSMKLDQQISKKIIFKKGCTTVDLIHCFHDILNSEEICFDQLMSLYASDEIINTDVVTIPIRNFFDLFEIQKRLSYSENELGMIEKKINMGNLGGISWANQLKQLLSTMQINTEFLKKLGYYSQSKENKVFVR